MRFRPYEILKGKLPGVFSRLTPEKIREQQRLKLLDMAILKSRTKSGAVLSSVTPEIGRAHV